MNRTAELRRDLGPSRAILPDGELDRLLERTSRTFAVSIPLLDEPTRRRVGLSYLLLRIADNFEDAADWPAAERVRALRRFVAALEGEGPELTADEVEEWVQRRPQQLSGYLELLGSAPRVLAAARATGREPWRIVRHHVARSAVGMVETVQRSSDQGSLQLESIRDLRDYCYLVAGIVGELLTELFLLEAPGLAEVRSELEERAPVFGEALQLVNIVKDAADDAEEGRRFLPREVDLAEVFALARADLEVAQEYVELMRRDGTPPGHLAFTALPVRLAWATLREVERHGAGAKVSRAAVARHVLAVRTAIRRGSSLFQTTG